MRSLQSEIEQHGRRILRLVDQHPESLFSKAGFYQRLMALSMRDEQFKLQLFRFVDVLPSLHRSSEIVEHLRRIFRRMCAMALRLLFTPAFVWRASLHGSAGVFCVGMFPEWRTNSSQEKIQTTW